MANKRNLGEPDSLNRPRLNEDEVDLIKNYRIQVSLLEDECEQAGIDKSTIKHYWYKSKVFSIFAKPNQKSLLDLKNQLMKDMDKHSPKYPTIKRKPLKDAHCLVIDPCDIHIGKLGSELETGEKYNTSIAIKRVHEGVDGLLQKAQGFNLDKIVLIIGNDILHTDNTKRTTTSGTPQDTDGMWYDNFLLARRLYVDIIEKLTSVANVHVIHNPSNHDFMAGWYLAESLQNWFRVSKNITFDIDMKHRKYFVYHDNLIGSTHGDGAKDSDLPQLMSIECKHWSMAKHRYIYTHHVHHKNAKDRIGVTIESSRSASGSDGWHDRNGYKGVPKAIEAYLHHPKQGQIARFTHIFSILLMVSFIL
jgi:hypothetical protein